MIEVDWLGLSSLKPSCEQRAGASQKFLCHLFERVLRSDFWMRTRKTRLCVRFYGRRLEADDGICR